MPSIEQVQHHAVGIAVADVHWQTTDGEHVGVYEIATNHSDRIEEMLANADIYTPAAWCAAAVYTWCSEACEMLGMPNPLEDVELKALVQSYVEWAIDAGCLIGRGDRMVGDLACFSFGGTRYDHMGLVHTVEPFQTVEANTHVDDGDDDLPTFQPSPREGYEVEVVTGRKMQYARPTKFIRWAEREGEDMYTSGLLD